MFEVYSFRAQQVIFLARLKAGQRGAEAVEVADLLAALIIEDQEGFSKALSDIRNLPKSAAKADRKTHAPFFLPELASDLLASLPEMHTNSRASPNELELLLSQSAVRVFERAVSLCAELQHRYVQPLHILAAILDNRSSRVAQILDRAGITREGVLKSVREKQGLASAIPEKSPPLNADPEASLYSNRTRNVLFLSRQEAGMHGSRTIEVEHMLIALILEDQGSFLDALFRYDGVGVDMSCLDLRPHQSFLTHERANELLARIEARCSRTQPLPKGLYLPMSPGLKRALNEAAILRDQLCQRQIEPSHLLAAIVGDESSWGAGIFRQAGVTRANIIQFAQERT